METKYFSIEEISKHNGTNGNDTWIIIKNNVYDVTPYLNDHPGGRELILEWAGKNGTKAFNEFGHSNDAKKELKNYKIGELNNDCKDKKIIIINNDEVNNYSNNNNANKRSFVSMITCGICK